MTKEFILSDCTHSSNLGTFRGNSNILLISCEGKEIRMISTKSGAILNSMTGVSQPVDYFVIGEDSGNRSMSRPEPEHLPDGAGVAGLQNGGCG